MRMLLFVALLGLSSVGCTERTTEAPAAVAALVAPPAPPPAVTKADWQAAAAAAWWETDAKTDGEGVTEFMGCFVPKEGNRCTAPFFGRKDGFRKVMFFTPANSRMSNYGTKVYLHSYLSLADCGRPAVLLNPRYEAGTWMFMDTVAIMADGDVVLEKTLPSGSVERNTAPWGISESAHSVLSDGDLAGLERAATASTLIVRFTGSKGYVTLPPKVAKEMQVDFQQVLHAHGKLQSAVAEKIPAACQ